MGELSRSAIAACVYSAILVCSGYLMAHRADEPRRPEESRGVLRGTGLALCILAMALPMARLVGTSNLADVVLLLGTVVAAGAAAITLLRSRAESASAAAPDERHPGRTGSAARRTIMPARGDPMGPGTAATARRADSDEPPAETANEPAGATARDEPAGDEPAAHTPPGQAVRALQEVDDVLETYADRLRLDDPDR